MGRRALATLIHRVLRTVRFHGDDIARNGFVRWAFVQAQTRSRWARRLIGHRKWPRDSKYPLVLRPGTSDAHVFYQIFVEREYSCLDGLDNPGFIIDCGANVGFSAAYFLSRFPGARVLAVEPDRGNFQVLQANVSRFGSRIKRIRAGVWSHPCGLRVERKGYRDGQEWAIWARACEEGETADVQAVDIATLLAESGQERISILKMDIERSELHVFARNYQSWLARCDAIVIELHDPECASVFRRAIDGHGFAVSQFGELTVCIRNNSCPSCNAAAPAGCAAVLD